MKKSYLMVFFTPALLCFSQVSFSAIVSYFDDTFVNADWTITDYEIGGGGTSSAQQVLSGGNSAAFREVTTTIPSGSDERRIFSFNFRSGATYDPQTQGAISSIDYSEDAKMVSGGQTIGIALRQDGELYEVHVINTFVNTSWTNVTANGLVSSDFILFGPGTIPIPGHNPDFSSTGSLIELGFIRGRGAPAGSTSSGATSIGGIDNWSVHVSSVPIPPALWLFGSGLIGLIGIARRSRKVV